jgi:cell wall-associated NlpC family hydrolase
MSYLDLYLEIPFKPQGRGLDGSDCWGLVKLYYYNEFGIKLQSYSEVDPRDHRKISDLIDLHKKTWLSITDPRQGDVVIMKTQVASAKNSLCGHVGVVVEMGKNRLGVLHIEKDHYSRIQALDSPLIQSRVVDMRRHADVQ